MGELVFGNATIAFGDGYVTDIPAEVLCCGSNADGLMASGHAGKVRLVAGPEVERELRAQAPLLLGEAYVTGPGRLDTVGVSRVVHIVANAAPGDPVQRVAVERGLGAALERIDRDGTRTLTISDLSSRIPNISVDAAAAILANALVGRLRRGSTLERVTIASQEAAYLNACRARMLVLGATPR